MKVDEEDRVASTPRRKAEVSKHAGNPPKPAGDASRLDAAAWIAAAVDLLAERGIDGIRVELLASRLGVTKGSFYWHFADRDALLGAMLADWRRSATLGVIARLDRSRESAQGRLIKLLRLPIEGKRSDWGADVELSIRLWGRHDPRARAALQEVDEVRLHYIERLLEDAGVPPEQAPARAILAYSYMRVAATLIPRDGAALVAECERVLLHP